MKRNLAEFDNVFCLKSLYCSLIRSNLEYCSNVWKPFYKIHKEAIERVQKRFLRFIAYKLHIPLEDINYEQLQSLLSLPTLENRRIYLDVVFLYKILKGLVDSPQLLGQIGFHVPGRSTRSRNLFAIDFCGTNYISNRPILRMCKSANEYCEVVMFHSTLPVIKSAMKKLT